MFIQWNENKNYNYAKYFKFKLNSKRRVTWTRLINVYMIAKTLHCLLKPACPKM